MGNRVGNKGLKDNSGESINGLCSSFANMQTCKTRQLKFALKYQSSQPCALNIEWTRAAADQDIS